MKLKPLFDRVIVEECKEETSKNGIFLGQSSVDGVRIGVVIAVGEGNEKSDGDLTKMLVKPDDKVVFNKFTCAEATIDNKKLLILRQTDILAVVE